MIKFCGNKTYKNKDAKMVQNEERKEDAVEDTADEEKDENTPVPLVTQLNNISLSIFPKVEFYINNQQILKPNRQKS